MNKIIQFHLKIKACDPAWRWLIKNEHLQPHELWQDCEHGHWLVDYLNKLKIDRTLLTDSICDHFIKMFETGMWPRNQRNLVHQMIEGIELPRGRFQHGARTSNNVRIIDFTRRPPTFWNVFKKLYEASEEGAGIDFLNGYRFPPSLKNPEKMDRQLAEIIRQHVPYDLVVAQREKMGG